MTAGPGWRLNLDLYQMQQTAYGLEYLDGLAIRESHGGKFFVDPQQEPDNAMNYGPSAIEDLILRVDEDLVRLTYSERLRHASLTLEDDSPEYSLRPLGTEKLCAYDTDPLGRAALVGLVEHADLTLIRANPGDYQQTRVLHEAHVSKNGEPMPYAAKLILLGTTGSIDVAYDLDSTMRVARVAYDHDNYRLRIDDRGSDTSEEGTGGDPEPRQPVDPLDSDSVALELPAYSGPEEAQADLVLLSA